VTYHAVEVVRRIEEALAGQPRLTLALFCRNMNVSRHFAAQAIKETKGISFRDLQQEVLLKKAKEMLSQPDAKIHEVASALGYRRCSDFGRFLRNKTSRRPSDLRREARQAAVWE
jgi:two-component system response regulator YesN